MSKSSVIASAAMPAVKRGSLLFGEACFAGLALASDAAFAASRFVGNSSDYIKDIAGLYIGDVNTDRHRTSYTEAGPRTGPLMIFVHVHPELGVMWLSQIEHFAAAGWRCFALDIHGYGGSTIHAAVSSYTVREFVADMIKLHDALGATPAVWVGHDWGASIACALSNLSPERPVSRRVLAMILPQSHQFKLKEKNDEKA